MMTARCWICGEPADARVTTISVQWTLEVRPGTLACTSAYVKFLATGVQPAYCQQHLDPLVNELVNRVVPCCSELLTCEGIAQLSDQMTHRGYYQAARPAKPPTAVDADPVAFTDD